MKIAVIGLGFVGGATLKLLGKRYEAVGFDKDTSKAGSVSSLKEAIAFGDTFILCLPTDFNEETKQFDLTALNDSIATILKAKPKAVIVIKSTVPLGYSQKIQDDNPNAAILFNPEFLRESHADFDAANPDRIVVGSNEIHIDQAKAYGEAYVACVKEHTPIRYLSLKEAESVKLFSNAYLAMRIAFFNELDSYAMNNGLNAKGIIDAVGLDSRIGSTYNNPSFGYGGYCLPKDTKQLEANFSSIPQDLISATIASNATRKKAIAKAIINSTHPNAIIGIYRLKMETMSNNLRYTCLEGVIEALKEDGANVVIYEPLCQEDMVYGCPIIKDFKQFIDRSEIIVANRIDEKIAPLGAKLFTRECR